MDTNPFQSPQLPSLPDASQPGVDQRQVGLARQVRIVGVLMIINGIVIFAIGVCIVAFASHFSDQFVAEFNRQQRANPQAQRLDLESLRWAFQVMFGGYGAGMLIIGLLGIFAGIRNYSFRGRVLGIISLVGNMAASLFCWCIPVWLGLLVYGLIIYLSRDAEAAFHWQADQSQRPTV